MIKSIGNSLHWPYFWLLNSNEAGRLFEAAIFGYGFRAKWQRRKAGMGVMKTPHGMSDHVLKVEFYKHWRPAYKHWRPAR